MIFEQKTLGQLSKNGRGYYGIGASAVPYSDELFTYLRITDIRDDGTLNRADLKSVADSEASKYLLAPNDIVFARTGASTGRNYFYDGRDGIFVYAGFLIKFSIDDRQVNPRYIKHYCRSKNYWDWIAAYNTGSTRGNINAQTLASMPIILPPREYQDRAVSILDSLDDKIELNNRINDNLLEQLFSLYQNACTVVIKNVTLGSLCSFQEGYVNPAQTHPEYFDGDIKWLRAVDINESFIIETSRTLTYAGFQSAKKSAYLFPPNTIAISKSGTIGRLGIVADYMCGNRAVINIKPNDQALLPFIYAYLKSKQREFPELAVGSVQKNLYVSLLEPLFVSIPDTNTLTQFCNTGNALLNLMKNNCEENIRLASIRDVLLPRLMSGKLDVSEVEL